MLPISAEHATPLFAAVRAFLEQTNHQPRARLIKNRAKCTLLGTAVQVAWETDIGK
jgi:hypothetical protein